MPTDHTSTTETLMSSEMSPEHTTIETSTTGATATEPTIGKKLRGKKHISPEEPYLATCYYDGF